MGRDPVFIGREKDVQEILTELKKGKNILLSGDVGIGKSAILQKVFFLHEKKKIYIKSQKLKEQLIEIIQGMTEINDLSWEDLWMKKKEEKMTWKDIRRTVTRMKIREMTEILLPVLHIKKKRDTYTLFFDDITSISPTQLGVFNSFFESCQICGCVSEKKTSLKKIYWKMKEMKIGPLSLPDQKKIIEFFILKKNILVQHPEFFQKTITVKSQGNPQAIMDILIESSHEKTISKKHIREMKHDAAVRYIDMTPFLLLFGVVLVCFRYLGMGMGNFEMYIIGGIGAGLFIFFRFFIYRGMRDREK